MNALDAKMLDITAPSVVDILISRDGKTIWINTEAGCIFRACKIGRLYVTDERNDHSGEAIHHINGDCTDNRSENVRPVPLRRHV